MRGVSTQGPLTLISKWEVVLGAPDRVNIPCLMHDTRLCQLDVKMTND